MPLVTRFRRTTSRRMASSAGRERGMVMASSPRLRASRVKWPSASESRPSSTAQTSYTASANWKPRSSMCTTASDWGT